MSERAPTFQAGQFVRHPALPGIGRVREQTADLPLAVPFWVAEPVQGRMLVLQLDQVDAFRQILASMSRAAR